MLVCTEKGSFSAESCTQIIGIVKYSRESWISGKEKYSCLVVLINGENACVDYFGTDERDCWLSKSEGTQRVVFTAGGEEWEAPADAVVSVKAALECVKLFCETPERPNNIKWQYGV